MTKTARAVAAMMVTTTKRRTRYRLSCARLSASADASEPGRSRACLHGFPPLHWVLSVSVVRLLCWRPARLRVWVPGGAVVGVAALFAFAARVVGSERRADAVLLLLVAVVLDVFIASLCGVCALLVHARGQRTPQWGCVLGCLPFVRYVWLCFALTTVSVAS